MLALFKREFLLARRTGSGALSGVLFFLAIVTTIPFAIGPNIKLLAIVGPALLWLGALLASLLSLDRLFQQDADDGSLDLIIMQNHSLLSLSLVIFIKTIAHWLTTGLPLVLAAPVFGLMLNISSIGIMALMATLLVGTPAIAFIGAVGAAVTVSLPRGGFLIAILVLPLVIPTLIFGVSAVYGAIEEPAPFTAPFLILCAISLLCAVLGPFASAIMLRHSSE